jgi:hypothetical protein
MASGISELTGVANRERSRAREALDECNNHKIDAAIFALAAARMFSELGFLVGQSPVESERSVHLLMVSGGPGFEWATLIPQDLMYQFGRWIPQSPAVSEEGALELAGQGRANLMNWFQHGAHTPEVPKKRGRKPKGATVSEGEGEETAVNGAPAEAVQ